MLRVGEYHFDYRQKITKVTTSLKPAVASSVSFSLDVSSNECVYLIFIHLIVC